MHGEAGLGAAVVAVVARLRPAPGIPVAAPGSPVEAGADVGETRLEGAVA